MKYQPKVSLEQLASLACVLAYLIKFLLTGVRKFKYA